MKLSTENSGPGWQWKSWNAWSIAVSVVVCGALIALHFRQQQILSEQTQLLNRMREARRDLTSGFLHVSLAGVGGAFDRGQGLALIDQAVIAVETEIVHGRAGELLAEDSEGGLKEFPARVRAFRDALGRMPDADGTAGQRIAFHGLSESVESVERAGERQVAKTMRRLDREFAVAVVVAALLLGGVSGGALRVARLRQAMLREIQANRRRLELFVENAPAALAMFDREMRYVSASRRWMSDYGLTGELIGRSHYEVFPEIGEEWKAVHRRALGGETVRAESDQFERSDGSRQWLRWETQPWFSDTATIGGIVIMSEDVTARMVAELALREAHALHLSLVSHMPAGVFRKDAAGRFVFANDEYFRITGLTKEELLGRRVEEVAAGFAGQARTDPCAIALAGYSPNAVAHHAQIMATGETVRVEERWPQPDGTVRHIVVVKSPVYNASHKIVGSQGVLFDVTALKQTEQALRESERNLLQAQAMAHIGNWEWNLRDGRVRWSPEVYRISGMNPDLPALSPDDLMRHIHPGDVERVKAVVAAAVSGGTSVELEYRFIRDDGSTRVIHAVGQVAESDAEGRPITMVGTNQDITDRKRAEAALRMSEEKFSRAFANNPAAIAITRLHDGCVRDVNETWERLCGYTRDEVIGRSARAMWVRPEDAARFVRELSERKAVRGWEAEFRRKTGEIFTAELCTQMLEMDGEQVVLSTLVDVTPRRRAEEALRTHEAVLRETGRIAKVGGWSFEVATGGGYWTEEVARIHDLDPSTVTSKERGLSYYHGEDRRRIEEAVQLAIAEGVPYDLELELTSARGRRKWVRTIGHPETEAGRVVRVRGSFQDVTERKRSERRLATQASVSRVLAEAATLGEAAPRLLKAIATAEGWQFGAIWEPVADAGRLRCTQLWHAPDLSAEALTGKTMQLELARGEGLPGRVWASGQVLLIPDVRRNPLYLRTEQATAAGLQSALAFPVMTGDEVVGVIDFLAREISETDEGLLSLFELVGRQIGLFVRRRQAEEEVRRLNAELEERVRRRTAQLEAANQELESFSYSVSHDLRAPLRAVDGFALALVEDYGAILPEEGRGYVKRVREGAQRMGRLIDDLLTFSRLGRKSLTVQPVEMAQLVNEVLETLKAARQGREVEIQLGALPGCDGDPALLRQVWLNLIGNALKYSRGAKPARIEIGSEVCDGQTVYRVRDNGAGFDMRYAHKLFGVFQRLHRADEFEGTGVGLAIVQRVVQRHDGRVWAEAEVGRGASFYFTINPISPLPP